MNVRWAWASSPGSHFDGAMRTDRVQDQMDGLLGWRLLIQEGQQLAELARAMLQTHQAAHLAIVDAEARQQVHRAVTHVLELAPSRATRPWRLVRGGGVADPDARLLVDTEQRPILRWAEQQLDDPDRFGGEVGIAVIHPGVKDGPGAACGA
jgi:hypothetical protein